MSQDIKTFGAGAGTIGIFAPLILLKNKPLRLSVYFYTILLATLVTPSAVVLVPHCRLLSRAPKGLQQLCSVGATQPGAGIPALTRLVSAIIPAGDVVECASISGQVIDRGI